MKNIKIVLLSLIIIVLSFHVTFAEARSEYGAPIATYNTPIGVRIVSFSQKWGTQEKLEQIYAEFTKNFMSSEISYLEGIYLYPDSPEGVAGFYKPSITIDSRGNYKYGKNNYIEILDVNTYDDVSEIAEVLSHEYGHHFTMYYLVTKENKYFSDWQDTGYAKVRNLTKFSKAKYYENMYGDYDHRWDVTEIAAEDYLQLFGSPQAKKSVNYVDVKDRIINNVKDYRFFSSTFNLMPQENLSLPLAAEVKGLREYWLGLVGYSLPEVKAVPRPKLVLAEEKILLNKYKSYKVNWNEINDSNSYEYTLVMYPEGDNSFPIPIKTVKTGEEMSAYIGSYMIENQNGTANIIMENYTGKYLLRLFIKNKDNFMFSSNEYKIDFTKPVNGALQIVYGANVSDAFTNNMSELFYDLPDEHWAYAYIADLVRNSIIKGYSDGRFKPESAITKAEFLALALRVNKTNLTPYKHSSGDWFIKDGYYDAAKSIGLIKESDYGKNYINFKYNDKITRQEMTFISARAIDGKVLKPGWFENNISKLTDISKMKYKSELNLIAKYDIMNGYPDNTFRPNNSATRAEASKIISKLRAYLK